MKKIINKAGINVPVIYLPDKNISYENWAVVACDQFTSEKEYWGKVEESVSNCASTYNLIYPEVYLNSPDKEERIKKINSAMEKYVNEEILLPQKEGFIYVERTTKKSGTRKGLMVAVDLEEYDYNKGSHSLIRATEGTVIDRLPPRIKIRENASIELPHIMVLIDDPEDSVIGQASKEKENLKQLYNFELMLGGGHIKGYKIEDESKISSIISALEALASPDTFNKKYDLPKESDKGVLLYAVGDGNHSLATAKAHYENLKAAMIKNGEDQEIINNHPARYALVEIVNVHDEALIFEPIHRVLFNVDPEAVLVSAIDFFNKQSCLVKVNYFKDFNEFDEFTKNLNESKDLNKPSDLNKPEGLNSPEHIIPFKFRDKSGCLKLSYSSYNLPVGTLQSFIDNYLAANPHTSVDYIHGSEALNSLSSGDTNIGFFLPKINKSDLFKTVILDGALPRKTFSMGEAEEKRYYIECRKIK